VGNDIIVLSSSEFPRVRRAFLLIAAIAKTRWEVEGESFFVWLKESTRESVERLAAQFHLRSRVLAQRIEQGDGAMAMRIEVSADTPEKARRAFSVMRAHWAVTKASWDGRSSRFILEAPNRPARQSVSSALRQLGVTFELLPAVARQEAWTAPAARVSPSVSVNGAQDISQPHKEREQRSGRRRGRKSNKPPDAEFLQSLRDVGVEETASRYGVSPLTVRNFWAKAVPGAKALIPDGRKMRWQKQEVPVA